MTNREKCLPLTSSLARAGCNHLERVGVNKKTLPLWHEHLPPPSPSCRDVRRQPTIERQ